MYSPKLILAGVTTYAQLYDYTRIYKVLSLSFWIYRCCDKHYTQVTSWSMTPCGAMIFFTKGVKEVKKQGKESETISPKKEEEEDALKVKEWEVGMFQNENEGNTPRNILEEIIWHKATEVSQMKEKRPLVALKKVIENAPSARDFSRALKAAHVRTGLPSLIVEVKDFDPVKDFFFI
ncbi:hypothetical protein PTKIN_Ptkin02bG0123000 [Pterospermum kingtungense]